MFGWKLQGKDAQQDMVERSGALDGTTAFEGHGLVTGTRVASNLGWRPVEALMPGDKVLTFDNGMQTVIDVRRTKLWVGATDVPAHMMPLVIPANVLGNRVDMHVLPEQGLMVESEAATDVQGDPFAVVAAAGLEGYRGIYRETKAREMEIVTLYFAAPQVIYAEGGLLIYCPPSNLALCDMLEASFQPYDILDEEDTAFLVYCMQCEDQNSNYTLPRAAQGAVAA